MSDKTRKKIFLHYYIDLNGETTSQFKKILEMTTNIIISKRRMQEFIKKNDKMSELMDKYDKKPLNVKEKKCTILVVKIAVGAPSTSLSQIIIEKRMENLT